MLSDIDANDWMDITQINALIADTDDVIDVSRNTFEAICRFLQLTISIWISRLSYLSQPSMWIVTNNWKMIDLGIFLPRVLETMNQVFEAELVEKTTGSNTIYIFLYNLK